MLAALNEKFQRFLETADSGYDCSGWFGEVMAFCIYMTAMPFLLILYAIGRWNEK